MSADLARFDFEGFEVRTVLVDGKPWFVAADVARILGYSVTSAMTRSIDAEDKGVQILHTLGGNQEMVIISEPGLYVAVIGSRATGAKTFKHWVTREVLPAIRRTGSYGTPAAIDVTDLTQVRMMLQAGAAAVERAISAEAKVAELEPAAEAWTALSDDGTDFTVREAAQVLSRDDKISIGQQRLFDYLREIRWIDKTNQPMQTQVDCGRLARRITSHTDDFGTTHTRVQPRITPKGIAELRNSRRSDEYRKRATR